MRKANLKLVQPRSEVKLEGAKVGEAVYAILSKPRESQEVGDTINAMAPRYMEELYATIEAHKQYFEDQFYIVVFRKKEPWAINVLRQWYIPRQTRPVPFVLREDYPNHDHDVWRVNPKCGAITLQWTLPTKQDSNTILNNAHLYDADLVRWIALFNEGNLQ